MPKKKTSPISPQEAINKLIERYPDGCPDHVIAKFFKITEKELETRYQAIISCLRQKMGVDMNSCLETHCTGTTSQKEL